MESQIIQALKQAKIVLVTGMRGTGKTTLLRKLQKKLGGSYQDLEDPRLAPRPRKETLEVFSKEGRTVLLDEVGRVNAWLTWARRQKSGVVASQSGPRQKLDAKDVVEFTLYPARFTDISVDIENYLRNGSLPSVHGNSDARRSLVDLFDQCLFKDVVQRYEVRDIDKLTAIAVYLLASTSRQVSASRLKGLLSRSVDQARGFLSHLEHAGLVYLVPRIEDGQRSRAQAARRCFAADCGLSVALASRDLEIRDLAETAVFHELQRQGLMAQAWRARGRLGLAVAADAGPVLLIDVTYRDKSATGHRALATAMAAHSCRSGLLLGDDQEPAIETEAGTIVKRNFSKWLQAPVFPGISSHDPVAEKSSPGLPAYLL